MGTTALVSKCSVQSVKLEPHALQLLTRLFCPVHLAPMHLLLQRAVHHVLLANSVEIQQLKGNPVPLAHTALGNRLCVQRAPVVTFVQIHLRSQ